MNRLKQLMCMAGVSFFLLLLCVPAWASDAPKGTTFQQGDVFAQAWKLQSVDVHKSSEFLLLHFESKGQQTAVEVRYKESPNKEEWATTHYRVQPAKGMQPPQKLLWAVLTVLKKEDAKPDHQLLVFNKKEIEREKREAAHVLESGLKVKSTSPKPMKTWLLLNVLAFLLTILLFFVWVQRDISHRWILLPFVGLAFAVGAVFFYFVPVTFIPLDLITPLHEGNSEQNIRHMFGKGVHAGINFAHLISDLPESGLKIRHVVHANVGLMLVNLILFSGVATYVTKRILATLFFSLIAFTNLFLINAAFSELPVALIFSYFVAFAVAISVIRESLLPKLWRVSGAVLLTLITVLMLLTRVEIVVFPVAFISFALLFYYLPEDALHRAKQSGRTVFHKLLHLKPLSLLLLLGVVFLFENTFYLAYMIDYSFQVKALLEAFNPASFSFLALPHLLMTLCSLPFALLFLWGCVGAVKQYKAWLFLPVSLLLLFKIFYASSHFEFFELFRYTMTLFPLCLVLALFGWKELEEFAQKRKWPKGWINIAYLIIFVLHLVSFDHNNEFHSRFWGGKPDSYVRSILGSVLIDRDLQKEVRFLAKQMTKTPECLYVSRVLQPYRSQVSGFSPPDGVSLRSMLIYYHSSGVFTSDTHESAVIGEKSLSEESANYSCVIYYRSLDCNVKGRDLCEADYRSDSVIDEITFRSEMYSTPYEYGELKPEITLGFYRLNPDLEKNGD